MTDTLPTAVLNTDQPATPGGAGPTTSEFWKSLAVTLVGLAVLMYGLVTKQTEVTVLGGSMAGVVVSAYTMSRGKAKAGALVAAVLMLALMLPGCAGSYARTHTTVPALVLAEPGLKADANMGVAYLPADAQSSAASSITALFAAVDSKDKAAITAAYHEHWVAVRAAALAGIQHKLDASAIGAAAASLERERVFQYEDNLSKLAAPSGILP